MSQPGDKLLEFIMQSAGASMPRDSSDLPLSSNQKPELGTNKKDNDRGEHQTTDERCQETKSYQKDKKTKKGKGEFLRNTICKGREDIASDHPEYCEGDSEEPNKGNEEISFRTKQGNESKVRCNKIVKRNKRLVKDLSKTEVQLEAAKNACKKLEEKYAALSENTERIVSSIKDLEKTAKGQGLVTSGLREYLSKTQGCIRARTPRQ
jgi:chromosome segregation ATPase